MNMKRIFKSISLLFFLGFSLVGCDILGGKNSEPKKSENEIIIVGDTYQEKISYLSDDFTQISNNFNQLKNVIANAQNEIRNNIFNERNEIAKEIESKNNLYFTNLDYLQGELDYRESLCNDFIEKIGILEQDRSRELDRLYANGDFAKAEQVKRQYDEIIADYRSDYEKEYANYKTLLSDKEKLEIEYYESILSLNVTLANFNSYLNYRLNDVYSFYLSQFDELLISLNIN